MERSAVAGMLWAGAGGMSGVWAGAIVRFRGGMENAARWCSGKDQSFTSRTLELWAIRAPIDHPRGAGSTVPFDLADRTVLT
jgi:hypothetical protein